MIFGIGTDLIRVDRVAATYERFGDRFVRHLLMPEEAERFDPARNPARFLAMRFAAKEAIVKALGTGFAHGVWIRDVGFVADRRGKPEVIFSARGNRVRRELGAGQGFVSLSDEAGLVAAHAVLLRA